MPNQSPRAERPSSGQPSQLDRVFQALAGPTRRAVIERLGRGPAPVGELAKGFDMALPSFLQHLAVLEESGLVLSRKQGRVRICRLAPRPLRHAGSWLVRQQALWDQRLDQLDGYLTDLAAEDAASSSASTSNHPEPRP